MRYLPKSYKIVIRTAYSEWLKLYSAWDQGKGKDQELIPLRRTPHGKVTETQENITYKRVKRLALSQQGGTSLQ